MTTTRRNHLTASHDRSPFISERRRKLFPIDDYDMDSELGHISPLCSDTNSDSDNETINLISDYDIMGIAQNKRVLGNETPMSHTSRSETMSPLRLSPYTSTFMRETPKKYSPSHNLKTPHDTSTKPILQKEQKILLEESKSLKRKSSPSSSPEQNKNLKIEYKNSKVRTALFPPEDDGYAPLSTKSFYSKNQEDILGKFSRNREKFAPKHIKFNTAKHKYKSKTFGQINNGVGHKIRKPKQRKMPKTVIAKAAKKFLETAPVLNDYLQDLKELRTKQSTDSKLIVNLTKPVDTTQCVKERELKDYLNDINKLQPLQPTKKLISTSIKQIQTYAKENKENIQNESQLRSVSPRSLSSPEDTKSRKFFKSSRAKINNNFKGQEKDKNSANKISTNENNARKFDLSNNQRQQSNRVLLEKNNDFDDEDVEPEANIDNILTVLSNESPQKHEVNQNGSREPMQYLENNCQSIFDMYNSNPAILPSPSNMISQSSDGDGVVDQSEALHSNWNNTVLQNGCGETVERLEDSSQTTYDIFQSSFNVLNPLSNVVNLNGHETADSSEYVFNNGCQTIFDSSKSNSDLCMPSNSHSIDNIQYLPANNNSDSFFITNNENNVYVGGDTGVSVAVDSQSNLTANPGCANDVPMMGTVVVDSNALEPSIVSSQVVFNNILEEDGNQTVSSSKNPLETSKASNNSNKITLEAHNSILASENSIQLHHSQVANTILSPISQMCNVTSGLAINSPKRGRNLSALLNNMSRASKILSFTTSHSADMEEQQKKLFPVFYPGARGAPERGEKRERGEVKRSAKKFKALHEDQMLLDAGQKKFGYTICNECNIIYHMGDPGDEIEHMNYHNASHILRFAGWKNEHLVADFQKHGRIIRVLPTDSKIWLKKVKDLIEFVKRDLGCYEMEYDITGSQVYLYIKNRTIAGCAVATVPKEGGHRMLSALSGVAMCSEESYPIKCGVSYIWVAANFRKQRIATALMDAVKNNFIYGYILTDNDVALTSPTEAGSAFAEKYFKTPNYLIYYT